MRASDSPSILTGKRVEWLTLGLGAIAALIVGPRWGWETSLGLAVGCLLSWINFRWLRQSVTSLVQSSLTGESPSRSKVVRVAIFKFLGRFVILGGVVYVILLRSLLPAEAVLAGLFAAVGAVLIEMIYLLIRGLRRSKAG
jgi:hypothetical protein